MTDTRSEFRRSVESGEAPASVTFMGPGNNTAIHNEDSPFYVTDSCRRQYAASQITRDLWSGRETVRGAKSRYLPRHPNESDDDYTYRLSLVAFRNYYAKAVTSILGKMFGRPPQLKPDVPSSIATDLEDANLNGDHWTVVAQDLVVGAINEGISWLLTDYTPSDIEKLGNLSIQEERDMGLRPYWHVIQQWQVIGIRVRKVGGIWRITQFRYREWEYQPKGNYGEELVEKVRVWEPDLIRTFRKGSDGVEVEEPVLPNTLGYIPIRPLQLNRISRFEGMPCLGDMAWMNVEHYQIRSDQRRSLSVASFPVLMLKGVDKDSGPVKLGPLQAFKFESENADMKWVESQGVHLTHGAKELEKIEADIRMFALSFENPQMYATATGRNIDASDAISPIMLWSFILRDVLELGLSDWAKWNKLPDGGSVNVNVSFVKNSLSIEGMKVLVEAYKEGALSARGLLTALKEYGLLDEDFDVNGDTQEAIKIAEDRMAKQIELKQQERNTNAQPDVEE